MSKLKLEIETLCVESFETAADMGGARGTVRGAQAAAFIGDEREDTVQPVTSDDPSFVQTCWFYTCGGCTTADPAYCPQTQQ
ncbi:MAG TPA: hypothetical protein VM890_16145 [Longimicrobium sp.]|jgi:hypothetical protein|nr:hypothetical protein [Longimicrobium sp.]